MEPSRPDISFVVETLNLLPGEGVSGLDRVLAAIARQSVGPERVEVLVVVDPHRHPGLAESLATAAPHVRVVVTPGAHYYAQKNAGAREARADVVGFVDADCDPAPVWAAAVLDAFSRGGDRVGAVQGRYRTHSLETSAVACAFLVTTFGHQAAATERAVDSLAASNCAFRRADLVASPFREDPVFHGPDVEKAAELRDRGRHILLVPAAASLHDHDPGLRAQHCRGLYWGYCFLKLRREGSGRVRYARLFGALGPLAPLAVAPAKAWIDLKRLAERRRDLGLGPARTLATAALLVANSASAALGAARCVLGLAPPREPQSTNFGAKAPTAPG